MVFPNKVTFIGTEDYDFQNLWGCTIQHITANLNKFERGEITWHSNQSKIKLENLQMLEI